MALSKVQKRLGGERFKLLDQIMRNAIQEQLNNNDSSLHKEWINRLLVDYYDPMYDYQITKKTDRVIFQGNQTEIVDFLNKKAGIS